MSRNSRPNVRRENLGRAGLRLGLGVGERRAGVRSAVIHLYGLECGPGWPASSSWFSAARWALVIMPRSPALTILASPKVSRDLHDLSECNRVAGGPGKTRTATGGRHERLALTPSVDQVDHVIRQRRQVRRRLVLDLAGLPVGAVSDLAPQRPEWTIPAHSQGSARWLSRMSISAL
jgi:hypothetical protein